jgi:excisionase family DNA binding protein
MDVQRPAGRKQHTAVTPPSSTPPSNDARMLPLRAAATYLGATVWFMRTLVWRREIPHLVFGKRIVFDRADLDRYVDSQKVCAA